MKILYCTPFIFNSAGTERVLSMKVNYLLQKEGFDIVIVTTDQKKKKNFFEFDSRIKHYDLDINYEDDFTKPFFRKYYNHYYKKNAIYKKKLKEILDIEQPDVLVSMFGREIEFIADMQLNCKVVGELHFNMFYRQNFLLSNHHGWIWKMLGKVMMRKMFNQARGLDKLVVLTKQDMNEWAKHLDNVCQIYNPLPYEGDEKASLDSKNMISVGRLSVEKNYISLVRAWKQVHAKHPDWTMNIWGDGELKDVIKKEIKDCNVEDSFILHGRTDNVKAEYLKNSAYVMTSLFEGFPMVLLEAASMGLPMISYECYCGPKDIIVNGENGFLVRQNDENALADAMCKVIEDEKLRKKMGQRAKELSENFSSSKILSSWADFYVALVK